MALEAVKAPMKIQTKIKDTTLTKIIKQHIIIKILRMIPPRRITLRAPTSRNLRLW
jgi:hypothetical protein